jgi:UDP-glucose 4-epimerase
MARPEQPGPEALFHFALPRPEVEPPRPEVRAAPIEKLLITGIAGGLGQLIAHRLAGSFSIVGVDRTVPTSLPSEVRMYLHDLRKRRFEDVFRVERPDAVVHLAFVRHFRHEPTLRHEVNVLGTRRVLEYAIAHGVKRLVVLSSAYVYGALPENPFYVDEESPLNVSRTYPEVRDLAEVDALASTFLWRHPEIATAILRPVNTLSPKLQSTISRYLCQRYVPTILGFNPMMQFIHEDDVAEAVGLALKSGAHGVFNVAGPGAVPLKVAIREAGGTAVPIPEALARAIFGRLIRLGLFSTPLGAMAFLKYPCTVDGRRFERATGYRPHVSLEQGFAALRGRNGAS